MPDQPMVFKATGITEDQGKKRGRKLGQKPRVVLHECNEGGEKKKIGKILRLKPLKNMGF